MKIGLSPCPNDTFLFYAWIEKIVGEHLPIDPVFGDIQHLNEWALDRKFPLIKLSFPCFAKLVDEYQLLPVGSALGFNCGPKIIAQKPFELSEIGSKTIAIPGKETTAHYLLDHLIPGKKNKVFCLYHEIGELIRNNVADCGVIIHESRFTFKEAGYFEIADLGEMWHEKTHSPLPLGGLAIARSLPEATKSEVVNILRLSLAYAREYPEKLYPFILKHAQEKEEAVVQKHIQTYVTSDTEQLSQQGISAIENLLNCPKSKDWLYQM